MITEAEFWRAVKKTDKGKQAFPVLACALHLSSRQGGLSCRSALTSGEGSPLSPHATPLARTSGSPPASSREALHSPSNRLHVAGGTGASSNEPFEQELSTALMKSPLSKSGRNVNPSDDPRSPEGAATPRRTPQPFPTTTGGNTRKEETAPFGACCTPGRMPQQSHSSLGKSAASNCSPFLLPWNGAADPLPTARPSSSTPTPPCTSSSSTASAVSKSTIRLLQHTLMFLAPLDELRYTLPAMSMSANSSCVVDEKTKRLITFGLHSANVPVDLKCKGCVAGDHYFAVVTEKEEVWLSGSMERLQYEPSTSSATSNRSLTSTSMPADTDNMRRIASKTLMIAGHGQRLAALTRGWCVRPLSIVPIQTHNMIPSRPVKFIDLGLGDDCFMIGCDSVLYKTNLSSRNVATPRRVMTLCGVAVSRIASGLGFHLIVDEVGRVYSVGKNSRGQLGNGTISDSVRKPAFVSGLEHCFIVQVAAGEFHSLVLTAGGHVYGCGANDRGQLGLPENVAETLRMTKVELHGVCVGIAAGPWGSMFAMADGRLLMCGDNTQQQLGLGAYASAKKRVFTPTEVPKALRTKVLLTVMEQPYSAKHHPQAQQTHSRGGSQSHQGGGLDNGLSPSATTPAYRPAVQQKEDGKKCARCCNVM